MFRTFSGILKKAILGAGEKRKSQRKVRREIKEIADNLQSCRLT